MQANVRQQLTTLVLLKNQCPL